MSFNSNSALYDRWFGLADENGDGRVTGQDAVKFFGRSGLPREALAKIWELANNARTGYLDRTAFHQALDFIAMAQQGMELSREMYNSAAPRGLPPPKMQGLEEHVAPEPDLTNPYASENNPYASRSENPYGSRSNSFNRSNTNPNPYTPASSSYEGGSTSTGGTTGGTAAGYSSQPSTKNSWGAKRDKKPIPAKLCTSVIDGLKQIYFGKVRALEEQFKFGHFFSPLLHESDFEAKPSVLLLGQYSTGKTTFIKFLLGQDYPGCHIGPEPTTDRFVVVMGGAEERRIPGNTLAVQPDKPYQGLSDFGTGFLSRFEGSQCPAKLLEEITIVDTPGVLSGEKQRIERNYNFIHICQWFAARCDLILLLFDPYKLDISDEFKQVIDVLRGHDDKVRVVLNKADQVDEQQLMRVYGALMWSLGKVFKSPEVCRVYIGSFNSEAPINQDKNPHGVALFQKEQENLLTDLYEIPHRSCDRKINEFVKRVRAARIHLLIIGHLKKQMPSMFGKEKAQRKVLDDLAEHFKQVQREHHLPAGDFPDVNRFREILSGFDISKFPAVTKSMIKNMEDALSVDVPNLVRQFDNPF